MYKCKFFLRLLIEFKEKLRRRFSITKNVLHWPMTYKNAVF